ncbi:hypothetical protein L3V82_08975 [Thiotrichales bacterium 19S3-7]|nr:hypothetical protein [Thiotrichales bacterium 19S3-7]MCF6802291.1 hypothetical protein [Thiotrichales bacterium 19S3-11]
MTQNQQTQNQQTDELKKLAAFYQKNHRQPPINTQPLSPYQGKRYQSQLGSQHNNLSRHLKDFLGTQVKQIRLGRNNEQFTVIECNNTKDATKLKQFFKTTHVKMGNSNNKHQVVIPTSLLKTLNDGFQKIANLKQQVNKNHSNSLVDIQLGINHPRAKFIFKDAQTAQSFLNDPKYKNLGLKIDQGRHGKNAKNNIITAPYKNLGQLYNKLMSSNNHQQPNTRQTNNQTTTTNHQRNPHTKSNYELSQNLQANFEFTKPPQVKQGQNHPETTMLICNNEKEADRIRHYLSTYNIQYDRYPDPKNKVVTIATKDIEDINNLLSSSIENNNQSLYRPTNPETPFQEHYTNTNAATQQQQLNSSLSRGY